MNEPLPVSVAEAMPPDTGTAAPDFTLVDALGNAVSLHDFLGNPVVLTFFGSAWDPARAGYLSRYNELLREWLPSNTELSRSPLHITSNGSLHQIAFGTDPMDHVSLLTDREQEAGSARRYGVVGRQAVFIIRADGAVHWRFIAPPGVYPQPEAVGDALRSAAGQRTAIPPATGFPMIRREFLATTLAAALVL